MKLVIVTNGLLEQLLEQLKSEKPNLEYLINNQIKLVKYYDYFQITEITNNSDVYANLSCGENFVGDRKIVVYLDTMCVVDKQKKFSVCLDADKVNLDSLIVRGRQASDAFIPLGMKGKKKLKDYFIDKKIPKFERDSVLLIEHDGGIIWVVGHEIDDRYKVTKDTKSFLVIEATPK